MFNAFQQHILACKTARLRPWRINLLRKTRKEGRNPDHNLCPVGKAVSRTFLTALRPWPKADAENQPSELGCARCAMLAEEPALAGETMVIISNI